MRAKEAANAAGGVHQATIGDFQDAIAEVDKELTELNKKLKRLEDDEQSDDEEVDYRGLWRRLRHLKSVSPYIWRGNSFR